ncbi:MAG: hypothetical protein M3440_00975, partial [Chloroflexota bacterium]|nr:hypothetical protein [Chloroflexota bacterium]
NLLRDDGVIFVSIDDSEIANLRALMNEVFGEEQFVVQILWKKRSTPPNDQIIGANHDYIVCFSKHSDLEGLHLRPRSEEQARRYRNPDNHPKGPWAPGDLMANVKGGRYVASLNYAIVNPVTGQEHLPSNKGNWRFSKRRIEELIASDEITFGESGDGRPKLKRFLRDVKDGVTYPSIWDFVPLNTAGSSEMLRAFGDPAAFESPKPSGLVSEVIQLGSKSDDLVIDFFAGSGTTGHAVMKQNVEDGGNRKYILVQLPETIEPPKVLDDGTRLATIADITRERVRRVGRQIAANAPNVDVGFRSYKLASSNFTPWDGSPLTDASAQQIAMRLEALTDNVVPGRDHDDILAEIILKLGYELTAPVERLTLAGHEVFALDEGAVLVCLDAALSLELFEAMVERNPGQIVCLDAGFRDDDELKVNASQVIRSRARSEESTIRFWVV